MVFTPSVNVIFSMDLLFLKKEVTFSQPSTSSFSFDVFKYMFDFKTEKSHDTDKNVILLQRSKAASPILVTLPGIVTEVRPLHSAKA